jgi:hypothetical protein
LPYSDISTYTFTGRTVLNCCLEDNGREVGRKKTENVYLHVLGKNEFYIALQGEPILKTLLESGGTSATLSFFTEVHRYGK